MRWRDEGFWLDFRHKIAYYGKQNHKGNCVPATEKERKAFIAHFYSKGVKQCTFRELKQFVDFHGVRIEGRIYATVHITDKFLYMDLLEKLGENEDFQEAMQTLRDEAKAKTNESQIKRLMKKVSAEAVKNWQKMQDASIEKFLKNW